MEDIAEIIQQFGFPIVAMVGLGYFVYYVWNIIQEKIDPAVEEMHITLIRLIDQVRMLDNDMIRLQEKVNTALDIRENEDKNDDLQIRGNEAKENRNLPKDS